MHQDCKIYSPKTVIVSTCGKFRTHKIRCTLTVRTFLHPHDCKTHEIKGLHIISEVWDAAIYAPYGTTIHTR